MVFFVKRLQLLPAIILALFLTVPFSVFAQNALDSATDGDGDGLGDLILANPSSTTFEIRRSSTGALQSVSFPSTSGGQAGNVTFSADFNRNGVADLGSYNRSTASWTIRLDNGSFSSINFGTIGDIPVPADYNGDGRADFATYSPTTGWWTIGNHQGSNQTRLRLGGAARWPVPADYDCDGKADPAVFDRRNSEWTIRKSTNNKNVNFYYGLPGDIPLPGDFNGNGCAQANVHRPVGNNYYISDSFSPGGVAKVGRVEQFGLPGDIPFLSNVDGDDRADISVFRPLDATWFVKTSTNLFFPIPLGLPNPTKPIYSMRPLSTPVDHVRKVPGDYDRDGKSDFAFVMVNKTFGQSIWNMISSGRLNTATAILNVPADAMAPGDFDGDGATDPGVVWVRPDGLLQWHHGGAAGREEVEVFGLNGDQPIVGDFDCDGRDDKAVVRTTAPFKYWFFDFAKGDTLASFLFGLADDKVYAADINGDECDELVVSRQAAGGIDWFYQNLKDAQPTYVQWGLVGDKTLTPADVNGDGLSDFLVVREAAGVRTVFASLNAPLGIYTTYNLNPTDAAFLTGHFSGINFNEFSTFSFGRDGGLFRILRAHFLEDFVKFGTPNSFLIRPDGTALTSEDIGGGGCNVTQDFFDGTGGALWKPVSDNTRQPVFLLPGATYGFGSKRVISAEVLGRDGRKLLDATFRNCCPNGFRTHWDVRRNASTLRQSAPLTIKMALADGTTECRTVNDPTRRED